MLYWLTQLLAGAVTGVISGLGIGGGTILMIWMTQFAGVGQAAAQGINLLYFVPTSASSLPSHFKNGFIHLKSAIPAAIGGTVVTVAASILATGLDVDILRKCFGGFLVAVGTYELIIKN